MPSQNRCLPRGTARCAYVVPRHALVAEATDGRENGLFSGFPQGEQLAEVIGIGLGDSDAGRADHSAAHCQIVANVAVSSWHRVAPVESVVRLAYHASQGGTVVLPLDPLTVVGIVAIINAVAAAAALLIETWFAAHRGERQVARPAGPENRRHTDPPSSRAA